MSSKPSRSFSSAFVAAMSDTAIQAARHEVLSKRMSAAATAIIAGLAIGLTAAPAQAQTQTQNNQVMRMAADVVGGIVGGAIGNQIGGGSGKKAATVAGAAAGVWVAEAMQSDSGQPQRSRTRPSNFGPAMAAGWGNAPGSNTTTRVVTRSAAPDVTYTEVPVRHEQVQGASSVPGVTFTRVPAAPPQLHSGTTRLSEERMDKLLTMERTFLAARDGYARAIYTAEQAADDVALDGGSRSVQQQLSAARAQQLKAQEDFQAARVTFTNAVEHMGNRGYDVHQFAHSHKLAQARVTAGDMRHGDIVHASRGLRATIDQDDSDTMRGQSYSAR